jgi:hypothetical protein
MASSTLSCDWYPVIQSAVTDGAKVVDMNIGQVWPAGGIRKVMARLGTWKVACGALCGRCSLDARKDYEAFSGR